ncbi:MAG: cyclic nucleotide-binding domain-containing protein [Hyphomicrobiaceae bacterium]
MRSIEQEVSLLRRIPLFAHIETNKLKLLAFTSERLAYELGQDLCRQGDPGDAAYVIVEGEADVLVATPQGEIKVAHLTRNAVVGEIAILCDMPRTATVRPTSDLEALRIKKEQFLKLIEEFPEIAVEMLRELASRVATTTAELTEARNHIRRLGG